MVYSLYNLKSKYIMIYIITFKDGEGEVCQEYFMDKNKAYMFINMLLDEEAQILETNFKYD